VNDIPLRTTVIGSYPLPGWYEYAFSNITSFGESDRNELIEDAVTVAIKDQVSAGLDVITDGEMSRRDFNLSFYSFIEGIELTTNNIRKFGPPAHDQRGKYSIHGELSAPNGLGVVEDYKRLQKLAPPGPILKISIPGPYTLSGCLLPNKQYPDRYIITEALVPIVRGEIVARPQTIASAIRIGNPATWQGAIDARDGSGGVIDAVSDDEILDAYRALASKEGIFCEPASAASFAGLVKLHRQGLDLHDKRVVCVCTGNGLKDPDLAVSSAGVQAVEVLATMEAIEEATLGIGE